MTDAAAPPITCPGCRRPLAHHEGGNRLRIGGPDGAVLLVGRRAALQCPACGLVRVFRPPPAGRPPQPPAGPFVRP